MEAKKHRVRIAGTDEEFFCSEDDFLLAAMRRAGFGPHGCHGGGCGVCKMKIAEGEYRVAKRMSRAHVTAREEAQGIILTCCVQIRSDAVLEAVTRP